MVKDSGILRIYFFVFMSLLLKKHNINEIFEGAKKMDKENRIRELISLITKYNYEYYTLDNPTIADAEYDKIYDELVALEKETGLVFPDSPTKKVGGSNLKGFKKVTHEKKLYSLGKCNSYEELGEWFFDMKNKLMIRFCDRLVKMKIIKIFKII